MIYGGVLVVFPKLSSSWEFHKELCKYTESRALSQTYWIRIFKVRPEKSKFLMTIPDDSYVYIWETFFE